METLCPISWTQSLTAQSAAAIQLIWYLPINRSVTRAWSAAKAAALSLGTMLKCGNFQLKVPSLKCGKRYLNLLSQLTGRSSRQLSSGLFYSIAVQATGTKYREPPVDLVIVMLQWIKLVCVNSGRHNNKLCIEITQRLYALYQCPWNYRFLEQHRITL